MALKEQAVLFRTSHHSAMLEIELTRRNIPFVKFGGLKFIEAAHVKDMLAVLRWAENPADRVTGFRVVQLLEGIGPATAGQGPRRHGRALGHRCAGHVPPAGQSGRALARARGADAAPACARPPIGRPSSIWCASGISRTSSSAIRMRVVRAGDLDQLQRIAAGYPSRAKLPDRPHARSAERHQRRGRRAPARRGLSDPLDHPLGQGPGVEGRLRSQRGRRLHPLRHGDRQRRGDRGGAAPALRRHDAGQGPAGPGRPASLLRARTRPSAATSTSTPRARASSRPRSPAISRCGRGRRPAAGCSPPGGAPRPPSTSPRACAACGAAPVPDAPGAGFPPLPCPIGEVANRRICVAPAACVDWGALPG